VAKNKKYNASMNLSQHNTLQKTPNGKQNKTSQKNPPFEIEDSTTQN